MNERWRASLGGIFRPNGMIARARNARDIERKKKTKERKTYRKTQRTGKRKLFSWGFLDGWETFKALAYPPSELIYIMVAERRRHPLIHLFILSFGFFISSLWASMEQILPLVFASCQPFFLFAAVRAPFSSTTSPWLLVNCDGWWGGILEREIDREREEEKKPLAFRVRTDHLARFSVWLARSFHPFYQQNPSSRSGLLRV